MASFCQQTCKRCESAPTSSGSGGSAAAAPASPAPASPAAASQASTAPSLSPACTCSDVPPSRYSCKDEAAWGKFGAGYMQATSQLLEGGTSWAAGR